MADIDVTTAEGRARLRELRAATAIQHPVIVDGLILAEFEPATYGRDLGHLFNDAVVAYVAALLNAAPALLDRLDALERERDGLRGPCPVCYEPKQYEEYRICTCCHTHFGYHDAKRSWSELRAEWLAKNVPTVKE